MRFILRSLAMSILIGFFLAAPAWAQETGAIVGTVIDAEGAPLPGVMITLTSDVQPTVVVYSQATGGFRFAALPPGLYTLTWELDGFTTFVNENFRVSLDVTTTLTATMSLSGVAETVIVTSGTPVVDVKKTGLSRNVDEKYMQSIPSARDPWVMMEHTAGVQVDRQNLGGSESGQQSGFNAAGSSGSDAVWTYDGAELTDMAATGASPMYYDFDAFEEISITTGGNDVSIATGGMRINFVTKRGGNSWRGSTRFYFTDQALQSDPIIDRSTGESTGNFPADSLYPNYVGNAINRIMDYGGEFGGPLVRDRLFGWGSFGKQDIKQLVGTSEDNTQLTNFHAKLTGHVGDADVLNFTFLRANKTKQGRGAAANRDPDATHDQEGPSPAYTGKWQRTFNDNFYLETVVNYTALGFSLEPQGGRDVQPARDFDTGMFWGSSWFYNTVRPLYNARVDGNVYVAEALGASHELKFGYSFRHASVDSTSGYAGGAMRIFDAGEPIEAWVVSDARDVYTGVRNSLYLGDTITKDRFTINAGLRFDNQTSTEQASGSPAHVLDPEGFPARQFPGNDPGWGWNSLSPRVGLTYALNSDARTIFRVNAARYYSQMASWELAILNTTTWAEVDYEWSDLNGNGSIDNGETGDILWISSGFDPDNPNQPSPHEISKTTAPKTDELIFGVDHELARNLSIGGSYIWKKFHNTTWAPRGGITSANYFPVSYDIDPVGAIDIYELDQPLPGYDNYRQRDDYNTSYNGIEFTLKKRFSDGWMANGSFNYTDYRQNYDSPAAYLDPTNINATNGELMVIQSGGSGRSGTYFGAATWTVKASGLYEFPYAVNLGFFFQAREGYINPQFVQSPNRPNGISRVDAWTESIGDTKLPTYWDVDLRLEKTLDVGAGVRMHFIGDVFNVFNNQTVLARHNQQNSSSWPLIREVMQGRVVRFALRLVLR